MECHIWKFSGISFFFFFFFFEQLLTISFSYPGTKLFGNYLYCAMSWIVPISYFELHLLFEVNNIECHITKFLSHFSHWLLLLASWYLAAGFIVMYVLFKRYVTWIVKIFALPLIIFLGKIIHLPSVHLLSLTVIPWDLRSGGISKCSLTALVDSYLHCTKSMGIYFQRNLLMT